MTGILEGLRENWSLGDTLFSASLLFSILVALYAVALIQRKIRVIESELQALRKDQSVISEELEMVAGLRKSDRRQSA